MLSLSTICILIVAVLLRFSFSNARITRGFSVGYELVPHRSIAYAVSLRARKFMKNVLLSPSPCFFAVDG